MLINLKENSILIEIMIKKKCSKLVLPTKKYYRWSFPKFNLVLLNKKWKKIYQSQGDLHHKMLPLIIGIKMIVTDREGLNKNNLLTIRRNIKNSMLLPRIKIKCKKNQNHSNIFRDLNLSIVLQCNKSLKWDRHQITQDNNKENLNLITKHPTDNHKIGNSTKGNLLHQRLLLHLKLQKLRKEKMW